MNKKANIGEITFVLEQNGVQIVVSTVKELNKNKKLGFKLVGYNVDGEFFEVGFMREAINARIGSYSGKNPESSLQSLTSIGVDDEFYEDCFDPTWRVDESVPENSLFWEGDVREFLIDSGLSKKTIEKLLSSIRIQSEEETYDFIIDFYPLRALLHELNFKSKALETLTDFDAFLYPTITEEYIEEAEVLKSFKKFNFKDREIKEILKSVPKVKNYQNRLSYYSKNDLREAFMNKGYSPLIYENVIEHPQQNDVMNEILAFCFKNTGKMYSSTDSLYDLSDKLYQLIKIGPKNTKLIAKKVKAMADIIEEMKKNTLSAFDYYTKKYPLLVEFIESISFTFNENIHTEFLKRHTDLVCDSQKIKKLVCSKKVEEYTKEQGIEIQKNEIKKNKRAKRNRLGEKINRIKENIGVKNFMSKFNKKNAIKDFIGEKINDIYARRLSYAIYDNSKKFASVDITQLKGAHVNAWLKSNQKLMKRFEKNHKSNYCTVSLPFTADVDVMNYLFIVQHLLEPISSISQNFILNQVELDQLDEMCKNSIINFLALAQDHEKALFESYENQNEIHNYLKKRKRNRMMAILSGLVAAVTLTSFGLLSHKKSQEVISDSEIVAEFETEEMSTMELEVETETVIETVSEEQSEIESTLVEENIDQEEVNELGSYPGEVIIEGIIINNEDEESLSQEKSFVPIGDNVDTLNNADVYGSLEDLSSLENSSKSYWGSNENLGRTVKGIAFENEKTGLTKIVYSNEDAIESLVNGYDVIGYQIDNMYSYNQDGAYTGSEGIYDDDEIVRLVLKK